MKSKSLQKTIVLLLFLTISSASFNLSAQINYQPRPSGGIFDVGAVDKTGMIIVDGLSTAGSTVYQTAVIKGNSGRAAEWSNHFGVDLFNECYSVIQTSDGGYVMVGRSNSSAGLGNFDAWMIKTDQDGNEQWNRYFGDEYIDEAYKVKETSDGGFIITGMTTKFGWAGEGWLIKTDAQGNIVWEYGYHPSSGSLEVAWDYIYDVTETSDGGFVFAGDAPTVTENIQAWIGKVDADGTLLWDHTYGLEYWERIFSLEPTSDGGFIGVGDRHWTYNDTTYQHDGWLLKFNESGDTLWTNHFGQPGHDIFRSVKQTSEGGYIVVGESEAGITNGFWGWIVKTDENGNELWNNHLSKGGLFAVLCNESTYSAGGIIVNPATAGDGWLLEINPDGTVAWESNIVGTQTDDIFLSLYPTEDGGLVGAGKYDQHDGMADYWIVKLDADGPEALTYFYENFDFVTPPALPEKWTGAKDVMLANTAAEIRTMEMGSTTSLPNAVFLMNGINGSNGQIDSTAFVALVTPYVSVGELGATITLRANGGLPLQVGLMSDPHNSETFQLIAELPVDYNYQQFSVYFSTPGEYYIALKHSNQSAVSPIFLDDILFEQSTVGTSDPESLNCKLFPNPSSNETIITSFEKMSKVIIHNSNGKVMDIIQPNTKKITINTANYPAGFYVVSVIRESGKISNAKLVIN
ncbi:MAG TPA: T9SS type A sorting domain-containing protein [Lentimicrobium sp.]|nr:T9SS type A sorting domain-containing protein [Lentimicrobium sp.]